MATTTKKAPAKKSTAPSPSNTGKMKDSEFHKFFVGELQDIYWAEKALVKALPKMQKNATSPNLITALTEHLDVTKQQVTRLEKVFELLGLPARAKKCDAMEGLIKEGQSIMEETEVGVVRDAGIIAAGQKVEHYEIASYGTLCAFAKILGEDKAAKLLHESLEEEKQADPTLTEVAEATVNIDAANQDHDEEDDKEKAPAKSKKATA